MSETQPASSGTTAPVFMVAPTHKDPITGAMYMHKDLVEVQKAWEEESHLRPVKLAEKFGDVESWVAYVTRFSEQNADYFKAPFLTYSARGLCAVLDYPSSDRTPNRCQWTATHPFEFSREWAAWMAFASGKPWSQKDTIEKLEDLAADIVKPSASDLANLLRTLRATVKSTADTELRPDGTACVQWTMNQTVKSGKADEVELPPTFEINIPVLKGHVDEAGRPVVYSLDVRVRVSVGDDAHLQFRFAIPDADRIKEDVYADRVKVAKTLLSEEYELLRATD
jgi:hypothetical protein